MTPPLLERGAASPSREGRTRRVYGGILFSFWAVLMAGLVAYLSFIHNTPLQAYQPPEEPSRVAEGNWTVIHLLLAGCPCSEAVGTYLAHRGPSSRVNEQVILIGEAAGLAADLRHAGWPVTTMSPQEAGLELGSVQAPWLLIYDPQRHLRYSGGYLGRPIHSETEPFQDLAMLATLQLGHQARPLAAFGCVTSQSFQRKYDPLGLKYTGRD